METFTSYEYMSKKAEIEEQSRVIDLYEAFGWELTGTTSAAMNEVTLSFKRDRKIPHKPELDRLQRRAEETRYNLRHLEKGKKSGANTFALVFGCLAVLVLGGGMSLVMTMQNSLPALIGGIALGIVGLVLCGVNYPIYRRLADKKTEQLLPVIDEQEEKLANLMEQANDLMKAGNL